METTTPDYYEYGTFSEDLLISPCSRDRDNNLGARLSIIYYFMFVFSLFGNGLVIIIIQRFERLTTVTNILLLNLVFSSLIFMSSLPFTGVYMQLSNWIFGRVMCKIVGSVYYMGFYSSVLFLTLLTFDRHLAVVYSLKASSVRNRRYAVVSCAVVWLVSGLACIRPMLIHDTFTYINNQTFCEEYPSNLPNVDVAMLRASGFYLQLFLFLIFPLAVITYCYVNIVVTVISTKLASRTVRLIFVIVLLFFICWIPFNVVVLMYDEATTCVKQQQLGYALQITRNIAYIYFCISPIFYTFVGKKFQNHFRELMVKRFPGLRDYIYVSQFSRSNMSIKSASNDH
ncbi:unnamed protein product [Menidia menidia]|uniref:(Atlantic silverside) hypothetical protein n=1 Tax=Menidia menidia TaxID=238744 RepID=A0A8S4AZM7_9TELE|nr:unnamed protein product [Menidia menidia]